ncbi:recombinase family protein [Methanomassiliicoccus luminyensis]|uniref:recombinase family protein n=1 Tax=Methanomassiliicoccus luminyensis TaxID=1080712 RepID=UPI00036CAF0E|nr:recombinase family protein [Methanomassiliicoccus luminyensis]
MVSAAIYIRVSTEEQAEEGYSLDAQQERLVAYCEAQGWDVAGIYADRGHTGRKISTREAYKRMMAEKDSWDTILVMKMDRIHRNSKNFIEMMDNLEKWGKKFTSMQEELDTSSAIGRFVVDMIQRIAQLESEQIGERTYAGMEQKATTGGLLGFYPPYGYKVEDNDLKIIEEEAAWVRYIFSSYLGGMTMCEIADAMNSNNFLTRQKKEWTKWSISRLLHNPAYAGYRRWDKVEVKSQHPAIIDLQTFIRVQELIASNVRDPRRRKVWSPPAGQ